MNNPEDEVEISEDCKYYGYEYEEGDGSYRDCCVLTGWECKFEKCDHKEPIYKWWRNKQ